MLSRAKMVIKTLPLTIFVSLWSVKTISTRVSCSQRADRCLVQRYERFFLEMTHFIFCAFLAFFHHDVYEFQTSSSRISGRVSSYRTRISTRHFFVTKFTGLQYCISWYINSIECMLRPNPDPNPNPNPELFHWVESRVIRNLTPCSLDVYPCPPHGYALSSEWLPEGTNSVWWTGVWWTLGRQDLSNRKVLSLYRLSEEWEVMDRKIEEVEKMNGNDCNDIWASLNWYHGPGTGWCISTWVV